MTRRISTLCLLVVATLTIGCVNTATKQQSYPAMYGEQKPLSILVVPSINESTAANAGDLLNVTVAQPFANHGYYVFPVPVVSEIFEREGVIEGTQIKGMPTSIFRKNFDADAVLFMTIESWDKNYMLVAGSVAVQIEYVLLSTDTNEILWSYEETVVVDTSGSTGNIIADLIVTAISTAVTDYVPVARRVHEIALGAMPHGEYHPRSGLDMEDKSVIVAKKESAVIE